MPSDGSSSPGYKAPSSLSPSNRDSYLLDLLNLSGGNDSPFFPIDSPYTPGDSGVRTPPLVQGSNTLYGEDLVYSTHHSTLSPLYRGQEFPTESDFQISQNNTTRTNEHELLVSPSLRSNQSEVTTPPSEAPALSLSPPPLNTHQPHPETRSYTSSRGRKSRPPRAPVINLKFAGGPGTSAWPNLAPSRHVRAGSNGEGSLMSALTESSYEAVPQGSTGGSSHQHSRQISWDQNCSDPIASLDDIEFLASIQQPILIDDREVKLLGTDVPDGVVSLESMRERNKAEISHSPISTQVFIEDQLFQREPESITLFIQRLEDLVKNDDCHASKNLVEDTFKDYSPSRFNGFCRQRDKNYVATGERKKIGLAEVVDYYVAQSASIAQKINESSKGSATSASVNTSSNSSTRRLNRRARSTETRESGTRQILTASGVSKDSGWSVDETSRDQSSCLRVKSDHSTDHYSMMLLSDCLRSFDKTQWKVALFIAAIALISGRSLSFFSVVLVAIFCVVIIIAKRMVFHWLVINTIFNRHYRRLRSVLSQMGLLCELVSMALDGNIGPALTPTTSSRSTDTGSEPSRSNAMSPKVYNSYVKLSSKTTKICPGIDPSRLSHIWTAPAEEVGAFRRALLLLESEFPFSAGFGQVDSRQSCLKASKAMFGRLHSRQDPKYNFIFINEILAALSWNDGKTDECKRKELLNLLRPDKSGKLSSNDLVSSFDSVYVDILMLRANLRETFLHLDLCNRLITSSFLIISVCSFYFSGMMSVASSVILSGLIIALSILIASFGRSTFDGLLFMLFHRPYNIGDIIKVANDPSAFGKDTQNEWLIESIGHFQTKVRHYVRGNVVTMPNSVLSTSYIDCRGLSSQCPVSLKVYFPLDVRAETIEAFQRGLEEYVETMGHDWTELQNFRESGIDKANSLLEYTIDLVPRATWTQSYSAKDKRAALLQFCRNLQNQVGTNKFPSSFPNPGEYTTSSSQQMDIVQSISLHSALGYPVEQNEVKF